MAALLPWALDALVRSRAFARLLPACVFALLAVAATLLKVIAPVYLAGSVLMALVAGLRDAGRRRAVLRNFVAVTGLALLVMMPRILQTFPRLLAYTHTATDESFYAVRAMSSRWTADRWLYYPLNFVNNGLGLPLAALTLAALIRWAAARSAQAGASQRKEAACILAGGVVLSYPVLTYGQTGGNSQYLLSWVPLSALFLVASVSALEPLRVRRLAVALTAIASLWGLLLAMRPPSLDSTLLAVGPLQVVARSDWYIGKLARNYHIVERPEAEPWPIGEFTDMILDREQGREVRVASSNPILCAPNLEHEALLRGGRLVSAQVPWLQIRGGDLDPSFLARIDYLIIDTPMFEAEPASAFLRYIGYDCEVLAVREVSAFTSVALLALSRPWDRPERVTARALDAQGIRRHTVRFGSGPRLLASEVLRPVALRGRVTVHTYWTGFVDSEPVDLEVRLVDSANRTLWQSETLVLEAAGRGGTGDILCMTATSSPLGSDIVVAGCALSLRAHGAGRRVAVTHPDGLPVTSDGELLIPQP
jgi:hypothetical protein